MGPVAGTEKSGDMGEWWLSYASMFQLGVRRVQDPKLELEFPSVREGISVKIGVFYGTYASYLSTMFRFTGFGARFLIFSYLDVDM